jgi:signal peptidase II
LKRSLLPFLLITLVLVVDQWSKFYIKTHFEYNEDVLMFGQSWARLHFVENEGMAFGITFDWAYGKLLLSLFRILMVAGLFWYLRELLRTNAPTGYLVSIALITAGAVGNIIDSAFYGLIFTESPYHGGLAQLVPLGQGYAPFLHGKVVDMFYFPMTYINVPAWVPGIFNVADAAISVGVFSILLFQRRFFRESLLDDNPPAPQAQTSVATEATEEPREG